jgi:hypothetical protein
MKLNRLAKRIRVEIFFGPIQFIEELEAQSFSAERRSLVEEELLRVEIETAVLWVRHSSALPQKTKRDI